MKGLKVDFEFTKKEEFGKEVIEKKVQCLFEHTKYRLIDIWCILDKKTYVSDFPALYYINECMIEFECPDDCDAEAACNEVEKMIEEMAKEEDSLLSIHSIKHSRVSIKNDSLESKEHKDTKVFVTGVAGQLGHDVMNRLYECGYYGIGTDLGEDYQGIQDKSPVTAMPYISLNIMDAKDVNEVIAEINPDVVIHCAAWNAVDQAEDKSRMDIVHSTNVDGTQNIANACAKIGCKMVYISTDYVFDGSGNEPWKADSKEFGALNVYGQTKLAGELAVSQTLSNYFIVRTSWAYGISGKNFVKAMLDIGKKYSTVRVVNDQIGTPMYMKDLAHLLVEMIATDKYGYYNATNEGGYISWYDFACEIFRQAGLTTTVLPVSSKEYGINRATRPANSRLDKSKLEENGFKLLPDWKDALRRYLEELNNLEK